MIGHLVHAISSSVHHFVGICEFKLELWSRNTQIGGKICFNLCDLDLRPLTLSFCMDITFINDNNSGKFCDAWNIVNKANLRDLVAATDLVIFWWMTPKNNKARLRYNIKLCVLFHIHQWIQTGVTAWKRPIWVKFDNFLSCVTLQFDVWRWKTIGHLFYATSSFVHHFIAIGEFKLELQSGNAQFGSNSTIFRAVWPWNLTNDLEKH